MLRISIRDSTGERVFATERNEILVGSREGVDLRIPDAAAAPNHCILRAEGERVRLLSLSSAGTAVEGRRVGEAMLAPGQEFAVGGTVVKILATAGASRLMLEEPPAPALAPPPPPARPPEPPPSAPRTSHDGDFAREVRETLARAPWYAVSLMLHVLILLVMSLVQTAQPEVQRVSHIAVEPPKEMEKPELPPDTPLTFEETDEGLLDEMNIEEPPAPARSAPRTADVADYEDFTHDNPLGAGDGRKPLVRLSVPLSFTKTKGGEKAVNQADLEGEQGRAADQVKRGLGDGIHEAKQKLSKEHVVVVRGAYDKIETLLEDYEWPYTAITRDDLLLRGAPKARILFVNCNNRPSPAVASKLGEITKRLLQGGCWVVTSDWSVEPYLTEAFPTIVSVAGGSSQRHTTVEVESVSDDRLLTGVFPRAGSSRWWLEDSSTMVKVTDKATLLVVSDDMGSRYGSRVVAFKFPYGRGMVVHLVGHFYQKDGNLHGLVAMHRLINNIIIERVRADQR